MIDRNEKNIVDEILRLVAGKADGVGWHNIEMRCRIPRNAFPEGTNVMTFLNVMVDDGLLKREEVNGKDRYFVSVEEKSEKV